MTEDTTIDWRELQRAAHRTFAMRIATVTDWSAPTPDELWNVHDLVAHVIEEQRWAPLLLAGRTVGEARARVGSIQATPELVNDPQAFQKFQAAQGQLTQALKSLIAVSESYPQLKSDQNFRDLQSQLEGTENRITVARGRYIQAVQGYNVMVRSFPSNLTARMFKYPLKQNFSVENEAQIARPPTVDFGTGTGASPTPAPAAAQ